MNTSRRTFALAQMCVRHFNQTATKSAVSTDVALGKLGKLKQVQKLFGIEDHQPVHIKAGFKDKLIYQATVVLTVIGMGLSIQTLYKLTFK